MIYPVNQHGEIARHMIAVGLPGARWVEVQTSIHVDHTCLKRSQRNVTRLRQHIAPVSE
jgi:hypothetical protein